ncbi:MAG: hypothetical protein FJ037_08965 [Chloroflexi bacterium]|nr:hypothetical protein [Chloroflexota bacterium]
MIVIVPLFVRVADEFTVTTPEADATPDDPLVIESPLFTMTVAPVNVPLFTREPEPLTVNVVGVNVAPLAFVRVAPHRP